MSETIPTEPFDPNCECGWIYGCVNCLWPEITRLRDQLIELEDNLETATEAARDNAQRVTELEVGLCDLVERAERCRSILRESPPHGHWGMLCTDEQRRLLGIEVEP